jgi:DNA-binding HxlR family transcriptional regulator
VFHVIHLSDPFAGGAKMVEVDQGKKSRQIGDLLTKECIFLGSLEKEFRRSAPLRAAGMVQQICGCKWSLTVYWLIGNGVNRPGEMARSVPGLTAKVLNDCLRRNVELGILDRHVFAEVPPRVEYEVTPLAIGSCRF